MPNLPTRAYYAVRRQLRPVKRAAVGVREWVNRLRHPARRRAALATLGRRRPRSILFVCLGNVCRSPYAEWVARPTLGPAKIEVASAGFIKPGRPPPDMAQEVARARGVDHAASRSSLVTPEVLADYDLAVVFDPAHVRRLERMGDVPVLHLPDLDPTCFGRRGIDDPWGREREDFERVFDRIESGLTALYDALEVPR